MGRLITSRCARCTKCGRAAIDRGGLPFCKPCQKLQKLGPVDLLFSLATSVGLLPQSYFDVLEQLKREYKCTGCRSVTFGETVTCETCMEHRYCSFKCLQIHKLKHTPVCLYLLIAKGISDWCQRSLLTGLFRILFQAKTLDDTGRADFRMLHYRDWLHATLVRQGALKQASIDTFMKSPAHLIQTFLCDGHKEQFHHTSPGADILMKRVKTKQVILETKKQNENVGVDSVLETVGNNLMKVTEKTKHYVDTFRDMQRVISNGMFAGCVSDDGMTFGVGWWKSVSSNKPKPQTLKTEVKLFAAALKDIEEPISRLKFSDFYGDSDSEEIQQEAEEACGLSNSTAISTEPISTESRISPDLSTSTVLENKQELQGTTNLLPQVSESMPQIQTLSENKITTGKRKENRDTPKKQKIWDSCMFCHIWSNNLKTCARCGFAKYCSKSCQTNGYSAHKPLCNKMREMNRVTAMIPSIVTQMLTSKYGTASISLSCDSVPLFPWDTRHVHILVKIVDVIIPRLGFFVITVEDCCGMQETLCLRHPLPYSLFHTPDFGTPLPLKSCLQPGNYILLIDVHLDVIFVETILACEDDQCFFILMK